MTNMVVGGEYHTYLIRSSLKHTFILKKFRKDDVYVNKDTLESWELVDQDVAKSATSAVARGAVGAALLGPIGILAGLSAKNKGTYLLKVKFKDGKESLLELDKSLYKFWNMRMI